MLCGESGAAAGISDSSHPSRWWASSFPQHLKTKGLSRDGVVTVSLQLTDSYARVIATSRVALEERGDGWSSLTLALSAVPTARRLKLSLDVEATSGEVWFDDAYLQDATWPLPSAQAAPKGDGSIRGFVWGPGRKRLLSGATVCTVPLGLWSIADDLGRYTIKGLPPGEYRLVAFHPDFDPGELKGVRTGQSGKDLELGETPVPAQLQDPGFEDIPEMSSWFTSWNKFGTTEGIQRDGWHKGLPELPDGFHPHSGKGFYGAVAGSNVKDGGLYQTIAVEPGALYEVSVWSYTYQTPDGVPGDVANQIGVDPLGGRDHTSPYVIWTPLRPSPMKWSRIALKVRPVKARMTIFLHHQQILGLMFNGNLFDDVQVRKIGPPLAAQ
ncbi:MAG: carboxypeptidase regulatory-like domain-containing protein [Armatimonadetes bacterium]|nr:carboxypeptidase regulatory-like domain-containing protein [Armatimonadota bacterium]